MLRLLVYVALWLGLAVAVIAAAKTDYDMLAAVLLILGSGVLAGPGSRILGPDELDLPPYTAALKDDDDP